MDVVTLAKCEEWQNRPSKASGEVMAKKVFLFGIDSISPDLLLSLARSGRMPTLRSLLGSSICSITGFAPSLSEISWPNFFTAVNPARHGRYFHSQLVPGSYRTKIFHPRDIKAPPYWSRLSEAGKKIVVVDVPKTCVFGPVNGIQIVEWAAHDQEINERFCSWPPSLADQLDRRFGADPIAANDYGGNGPRDIGVYRDSSVANVARKTRLATALMKEEAWDHFLIVYDDGHHVGHYTWHLHDRDHPDFDPASRERFGDPLEDICVAIDSALREVLANLEPNCLFSLFVSSGIGPSNHATYVLDTVLRRLEGAKPGRGRPVNSLRTLWRATPVSLNRLLTPLQNAARNALLEPDRRRRKVFMLPSTDDSGAVRINLAGREPNGLVQPGKDYAQFCGRLEQSLLALRNAENGAPVIESVTRVADICGGPYLDHLPDLVVNWNRAYPIRALESPEVGRVRMPERNSRKGMHTNKGLFLVKTARGKEEQLAKSIQVTDIAPTICSWMDVDLVDVDGSVVQGLSPH
jgi:predicted AlkP superfamily phosphohydrolase/phosphomutase